MIEVETRTRQSYHGSASPFVRVLHDFIPVDLPVLAMSQVVCDTALGEGSEKRQWWLQTLCIEMLEIAPITLMRL